jgi:hypothetical protein
MAPRTTGKEKIMKTKTFDLDTAIKDLAIDRPVMRVEPLEDGSVRLFLYAGGFVDWPPDSVGADPSGTEGTGSVGPGEGKSSPPKTSRRAKK